KGGEASDIGEENSDRLVCTAELEGRGVFQQLIYDVLGHETAKILACDLFARKAIVGLDGLDRDGCLGSYGTDEFQMVGRKRRKGIEPVRIKHPVNARLRHQRSADGRADALR